VDREEERGRVPSPIASQLDDDRSGAPAPRRPFGIPGMSFRRILIAITLVYAFALLALGLSGNDFPAVLNTMVLIAGVLGSAWLLCWEICHRKTPPRWRGQDQNENR
jgi:hypothetical protein